MHMHIQSQGGSDLEGDAHTLCDQQEGGTFRQEGSMSGAAVAERTDRKNSGSPYKPLLGGSTDGDLTGAAAAATVATSAAADAAAAAMAAASEGKGGRRDRDGASGSGGASGAAKKLVFKKEGEVGGSHGMPDADGSASSAVRGIAGGLLSGPLGGRRPSAALEAGAQGDGRGGSVGQVAPSASSSTTLKQPNSLDLDHGGASSSSATAAAAAAAAAGAGAGAGAAATGADADAASGAAAAFSTSNPLSAAAYAQVSRLREACLGGSWSASTCKHTSPTLTHTLTSTNKYTQIHTNTHSLTHTHSHSHSHTHSHTHTQIHTNTHTLTHSLTHTHTLTHTNTHKYTQIHTNTHTHALTHNHTHTCHITRKPHVMKLQGRSALALRSCTLSERYTCALSAGAHTHTHTTHTHTYTHTSTHAYSYMATSRSMRYLKQQPCQTPAKARSTLELKQAAAVLCTPFQVMRRVSQNLNYLHLV